MTFKIFRFHSYEYKPSLVRKRKTKLKILTDKYEKLFLKLIDKEELSYDEDMLYLNAFNDVKKYLVSGLLINIQKNYSSKKPIEQKLETLFNQYRFFYDDRNEFLFRVRDEFEEICEELIYSSLGYGKGNKVFDREKENANFISFLSIQLFYAVLNNIERKVNSIKISKDSVKEDLLQEDISEKISKEEEIIILLRDKNINNAVDERTFIEIKNILLNKESIPENLEGIIKYILE